MTEQVHLLPDEQPDPAAPGPTQEPPERDSNKINEEPRSTKSPDPEAHNVVCAQRPLSSSAGHTYACCLLRPDVTDPSIGEPHTIALKVAGDEFNRGPSLRA